MYRRFLGAERDVPVEVDNDKISTETSLEDFFDSWEEMLVDQETDDEV
jgi:hypothetical protein